MTTVGRGDERVTRRGPRAAAGGATVTGRVTQLQLDLTITNQLQLGVTGVVCVLYCTALYCTVLYCTVTQLQLDLTITTQLQLGVTGVVTVSSDTRQRILLREYTPSCFWG